MRKFTLEDHADSFLPEGKEWKLVWHDEFDGTELDETKWGFRLNFWGQRFKTFTTEGVELDGNSHIRLHMIKKGDDYYSPLLQTGSLTYDMPKEDNGFWPFGEAEKPKFMHRYGYYEIRCRLPKNRGWHAAFWLQAPGIGSHPNPRFAGVECDIMENYRQHVDGKMIGGTIWGGIGKNIDMSGHFVWDYEETADGWHYYGVDWSPDGYVFYADGKEIGRVLPPEREAEKNIIRENPDSKTWILPGSTAIGPVSEVEQFILVTTECHGYRGPGFFSAPEGHPAGTPAPILKEAVLPDYFEVDHVRVFDQIETEK
ncbi:MAG: glycoside hydrolase family 16 protein [Lentisphaeria bacterium]|nr:glycoside hydrolase family 16 protein [Lentisphaeria bacterium]